MVKSITALKQNVASILSNSGDSLASVHVIDVAVKVSDLLAQYGEQSHRTGKSRAHLRYVQREYHPNGYHILRVRGGVYPRLENLRNTGSARCSGDSDSDD